MQSKIILYVFLLLYSNYLELNFSFPKHYQILMWSLKFLPVSNNEIIADWREMHQRESEQAMGFVMGTEDRVVIG